jgi:hypothetical protein
LQLCINRSIYFPIPREHFSPSSVICDDICEPVRSLRAVIYLQELSVLLLTLTIIIVVAAILFPQSREPDANGAEADLVKCLRRRKIVSAWSMRAH